MNKHILFFKNGVFFAIVVDFIFSQYWCFVYYYRMFVYFMCIWMSVIQPLLQPPSSPLCVCVLSIMWHRAVVCDYIFFFFGLKWYSMLCKFCFCYWIHILLLLPLRFCLNRETSIAIHPLCICVIEWAICSIGEKKELRTRINKKIEINREKKEWIDKILQFKQRHHKQKVKRGKIGLCFFCFNVIKFCLCQRQYNPIEKRIQKKTVES